MSGTEPEQTEGEDTKKAQKTNRTQRKAQNPRVCNEDNFDKSGSSGRRQTHATSRSGSPCRDETESSFRVPGDEEDEPWTKAQLEALHDAYSMIKPSVDFWSLIAKRVPGRNAEECFNKFYSSHPTPPPASQRSCSRNLEPPLSCSKPANSKPVGTKRRLLQAHKKVRRILRKQQQDDEDYETDAFAALEHPDVVENVKERPQLDEAGLLKDTGVANCGLPGSRDCSDFQSSLNPHFLSMKENWRPETMDSNSLRNSRPELDTPEVLRKVKDPIMLDKYIDHLHQRQTKVARIKSGYMNAEEISNVHIHRQPKDGLKFTDVTKEIMHRAKEELRSVFGRSGREVDHLVDLGGEDQGDSTDMEEDGSVET